MNSPQTSPQTMSPRERLRELLAIPDRQRTDAQWDEINELEITLASTMRIDPQQQQQQQQQRARRNGPGMPGGQPGHTGHPKPAGGGGPPGKNKHRKFHKRRPKPDTP